MAGKGAGGFGSIHPFVLDGVLGYPRGDISEWADFPEHLAEELTEKYRLVFAFCDLQGFSYEETAQILGMPIAAVKSRLHLARLYLRERLSRYHRDGRVV